MTRKWKVIYVISEEELEEALDSLDGWTIFDIKTIGSCGPTEGHTRYVVIAFIYELTDKPAETTPV